MRVFKLFGDDKYIFYIIGDTEKIFSYDSAHIEIDVEDCFMEDNNFDIYATNNPNYNTLNGACFVITKQLKRK